MATAQTNNALERLYTEQGDASNWPEGACFTTEQVVCKSNAGYYVGTWCIEVIGNQWCPQPNSRDSGYMSESEAEKLLAYWERF